MKLDIFENISDEYLFLKFQQENDKKAFTALYNRYNKKVFAYCLRACSDRETAKDVFQKIYTSIVDNKNSFKGGSYVAWQMIITRNYCLMEKRTAKKKDEIYENTLIDDESGKEDYAFKELIRNEVEKLPDEFREIVKLRYFDDFSYNEIADITEISLALVKVRLFRAKKLLTTALYPLREQL